MLDDLTSRFCQISRSHHVYMKFVFWYSGWALVFFVHTVPRHLNFYVTRCRSVCEVVLKLYILIYLFSASIKLEEHSHFQGSMQHVYITRYFCIMTILNVCCRHTQPRIDTSLFDIHCSRKNNYLMLYSPIK